MIRLLQRALAAAVSAALVLVSPGFEAYAVAGNTVSAPAAAAPSAAPVTVPSISIKMPGAGAGVGAASIGSLALPEIKLAGVAAPALPGAAAQSAQRAAERAVLAPAASADARARVPGLAAALGARHPALAPALGAVEQAFSPLLQTIQQGSPAQAHGAGREIEARLTGERTRRSDDAVPTANATAFGDGFFFAKPAGDSIRQANEALAAENDNGGTNVPTPPSNDRGGNDGGDDGQSPAPRIPLAAKVVSAAIALAPIALIGWPLIAAGSTVLGSLVIAGSVGYASFPFIAGTRSKAVKALPGVAVTLLGAAALTTGMLSGAFGFAAIGALAGLGGWGLMRWANKKEHYPDETEILLTMLGMLGAIAAVGLAAAPVAGAAAIVKIAAIPATIPLLMHLPGWVGDTITNAVKALYRSTEQSYHVATSLRRDTTLRRRLVDYSEAALEQSSWNILWLGLFIWLPILVSETIQFFVGLAAGLTVGALRVPQIALWTLVHHFAKDSSFNKRLAFGARKTAALSAKAGYFNAMERPFQSWANSDSVLKRVPGAIAIRLAQVAWLLSVPLVTLGATLGAWAFAGSEAQKPYDYQLHSPDYLKMPRDTMGDGLPVVDKPKKAPGSLPARLLASGIGAATFWLLTLPAVFGGGLLGGLLALTGVAVAAMPLVGKRLSPGLAKAPGTLLTATGLFTVLGAARYMLLGLPTGPILAVGVVAALAGFGLRNLVTKIRDEDKRITDTDDWRYSLGYVGALGTLAALSVALAGGGGLLASILYWGGMVSSLALLAHLPSYLWKALSDSFGALFASVGHAWDGLGAWADKTRFHRNYLNWLASMIERWSIFVAPALIPHFIPVVVAWAAQVVSSLAVGLALGVYHFPGVYAWSAAYHANPKSKLTRFLAGFNTAIYSQLLGTRKTMLEKWVGKLEPAASSTANEYRRPTLKAFAAMLGIAVITTVWLARVALTLALSPILWIYAAIKGFQRMGQPPSENAYEDGPDNVF